MLNKIEFPIGDVLLETVLEAMEIVNPKEHERLSNVISLNNIHDGQILINNEVLYLWFTVPNLTYQNAPVEATVIIRPNGTLRMMISATHSRTYRSERFNAIFSGEDDFFQKSVIDKTIVGTYNESLVYEKLTNELIGEYHNFYDQPFEWKLNNDYSFES